MKQTLLILFALVALNSYSQDLQTVESNANSNYWYATIHGGTQFLLSENANQLKFPSRLRPAYAFSVGNTFSPYFGIRVKLEGRTLKGLSTKEGDYLADPSPRNYDPVRDYAVVQLDGSYNHFIRYVNSHIDIRLKALNILFGKGEVRKWELTPSFGIGYMYVFAYKGIPKSHSLSRNLAISLDYAITPALSVGTEVQSAFVPNNFEGRVTERTTEGYISGTIGLTYRFGKPICDRKINPEIMEESNTETNLTDSLTTNTETTTKETTLINNINKTTTELLLATEVAQDSTNNKAIEAAQKQSLNLIKNEVTLAVFLFDNGKDQPQSNHEIQYINLVKFMKDHPKSKLRLDGYADSTTGTKAFNLTISEERVVSVKNKLVKKYGINPSRILENAIGVERQPYENNDLNRVVIAVPVE